MSLRSLLRGLPAFALLLATSPLVAAPVARAVPAPPNPPAPVAQLRDFTDYEESVRCAPERRAPAAVEDSFAASVLGAPSMSLSQQEALRWGGSLWALGETLPPAELVGGARDYRESVACGNAGPRISRSLTGSVRWMPESRLADQQVLPVVEALPAF